MAGMRERLGGRLRRRVGLTVGVFGDLPEEMKVPLTTPWWPHQARSISAGHG